jgi:hypothetical protein
MDIFVDWEAINCFQNFSHLNLIVVSINTLIQIRALLFVEEFAP